MLFVVVTLVKRVGLDRGQKVLSSLLYDTVIIQSRNRHCYGTVSTPISVLI